MENKPYLKQKLKFKMLRIKKHLSVITPNINVLNSPIKDIRRQNGLKTRIHPSAASKKHILQVKIDTN